jgi:myo-inositol-1(or 4)-monophosphatase
MNYSGFIEKTLKSASEIANKNFGKVKGTTKSGDNNQVLTQTDLEIGKFIISEIEKEFPEYNVIDEEAGVIDRSSNFTWVVDPIDGTSNFANGIPTFGIIIGLLGKDVPIAGGVALPRFDRIITAEKGKGAFEGNNKLQISNEPELKKSLIAYGIDGHQENPNLTRDESKIITELVLNIRNLRSSNSVFDSVMVMQGSYGAYMSRTSKIWDNVGQHIIIEEAGGVYTNYFGEKCDYSEPLKKAGMTFNCCFGASQIHEQIQELIKWAS